MSGHRQGGFVATTGLLVYLLVLSVVAGSAYWQGRQDGKAVEVSAQAREERIAVRATEAAASAAAAAISRIEVKHVNVRQQLEREVLTREVFRDCRSGPSAVQLFNSTIPGAAEAASAPDHGQLPAADADR